jgi:hypothetical protein
VSERANAIIALVLHPVNELRYGEGGKDAKAKRTPTLHR